MYLNGGCQGDGARLFPVRRSYRTDLEWLVLALMGSRLLQAGSAQLGSYGGWWTAKMWQFVTWIPSSTVSQCCDKIMVLKRVLGQGEQPGNVFAPKGNVTARC